MEEAKKREGEVKETTKVGGDNQKINEIVGAKKLETQMEGRERGQPETRKNLNYLTINRRE